jgi:hypothetical protein
MTLNGRAAETTWEAHPCGHRARRTAAFYVPSARRPSERAGYARCLATRDCGECWKAAGHVAAARERSTWLAGRSAEEPAETAAWETRAARPALDGPRDCEWGRRVRLQLLAAAHDTLGLAEEDFAVRVEDPARGIDSVSRWGCRSWSSQHETEPGDLEEQGSDAASIETAATSGNSY